MNANAQTRTNKIGESLISAMSVGAVFILIGMVFVLAQPNSLWDSMVTFFSNLTVRSVPGMAISLPAPTYPAAHEVLYTAAFQFCIGLGILQVIILALRFMIQSKITKTAETLGNLVYWFGAAYLIMIYLGDSPDIRQWFMFWAGILIMLGVSFMARALVLLTKRR